MIVFKKFLFYIRVLSQWNFPRFISLFFLSTFCYIIYLKTYRVGWFYKIVNHKCFANSRSILIINFRLDASLTLFLFSFVRVLQIRRRIIPFLPKGNISIWRRPDPRLKKIPSRFGESRKS